VADEDIDVKQVHGPADSAEPADAADTAEPADATEPADAATAKSAPGPGGRGTRRAAVVLGAVTVILGAFGAWATVAASGARAGYSAQNVALTNGPATAAVKRQITAAVNTIFSYNYASTAATRQAAQGLLTGAAIRQYDTLFALVTKNAPAQKLVVTTRVTNSGVELLNGNRARVLVFANQQDTRAGTGQTSYAGAMFAVTALHQGGRWKIENIDTFSG
jgi:Mce-associated membrane protein